MESEYVLIRKRTLADPHIVLLFTGTMAACQWYWLFHDGEMERWPKGEIDLGITKQGNK